MSKFITQKFWDTDLRKEIIGKLTYSLNTPTQLQCSTSDIRIFNFSK